MTLKTFPVGLFRTLFYSNSHAPIGTPLVDANTVHQAIRETDWYSPLREGIHNRRFGTVKGISVFRKIRDGERMTGTSTIAEDIVVQYIKRVKPERIGHYRIRIHEKRIGVEHNSIIPHDKITGRRRRYVHHGKSYQAAVGRRR